MCPPLPSISCVCQLERLIEKNYYLHKSARDGYRSYLQAYASHSLKTVFNVDALDLVKVAKAFGFSVPPSVNLSILHHRVCGGGGRGGHFLWVCLEKFELTFLHQVGGWGDDDHTSVHAGALVPLP